MKRYAIILCVLTLLAPAFGRSGAFLRHVQTITLSGVAGRIDHISADVKGKRLFVAALGNGTVEVVDLSSGRRIHSIDGLSEPQGVAYLSGRNEIFVANGGDGRCCWFDGRSYKLMASTKLSDDADNVAYDDATKRVYVGYGDGAIAIFDAVSHRHLGDIKLTGHPERFVIDKSAGRVYVNVPSSECIAVADLKTSAVVGRWRIPAGHANFPMAIDTAHHRLFVGTRRPSLFVVMDTRSGRQVAAMPCVGDADDLFYDATQKRIFASGGEGSIDIFAQSDADHYRRAAAVGVPLGARTSLFVPELRRLYVAVPRHGAKPAAIEVFATD